MTNPSRPRHGHDSNDDDQDDPITATYQVFLNPSLPLGRKLLVLQQPNRTDEAPRPPPSQMRLKSLSGMVEVDMPLDTTAAYDREKGLRWGRTLHASMAVKNGGSHGLAGGFGLGAVQQRAGRKKGEPDEDDVLDWNEAVRQGKVLSTQTLGGQYPDSNQVQYMVGVFRGSALHLTPVSSLVHLRPQLHHLDAATHQERNPAAGSKDAVSGATSSAAPAPAARAIHMSIKTTSDGDAVTTETMADRLRLVQSEPWRRLRYVDENDETAWEVYNNSLFLSTAAAAADNENEAPSDGNPDKSVPCFAAKWDDKKLLQLVSGITPKPDPAPAAPPASDHHLRPPPNHLSASADGNEPRRNKGRTRGSSSAPAPRRGSRARTSTSRARADVVNLD